MLLRRMEYSPAYPGNKPHWRLHLTDADYRVHFYEASTIEGMIAKVKADGHQLWGSDLFDYALPPHNAIEYILFEAELKRRGFSDAEIAANFSLNIDKNNEDKDAD